MSFGIKGKFLPFNQKSNILISPPLLAGVSTFTTNQKGDYIELQQFVFLSQEGAADTKLASVYTLIDRNTSVCRNQHILHPEMTGKHG